jgi:hypothetical protein
MSMQCLISVVVVILLLVGGCSQSEKLGRAGIYDPGNRIDFRALRVGQESRYVGWEGTGSGGRDVVSLIYTTDTLTVHVVDITDSGVVLEERLMTTSRSRHDEYWYPDSVQRYRIQIEDEKLRFIGGERGSMSRLNWNPGLWTVKDYIRTGTISPPLSLDVVDSTIVDFRGWIPRHGSGFVWSHEQLGRAYYRLIVIVDNTAMGIDGSGYFVLYSREAGIVRYVVSPSGMWGSHVSWGWDLL